MKCLLGRNIFLAEITSAVRPVRFMACSEGLAQVAVDRNTRGVAPRRFKYKKNRLSKSAILPPKNRGIRVFRQ